MTDRNFHLAFFTGVARSIQMMVYVFLMVSNECFVYLVRKVLPTEFK